MPGELPAGWIRCAVGDVLAEHHDRVADQELLPLSLTKHAGLVPAVERFGRALHGKNVARYRIVHPDDVVLDPMLLWDGAIARSHRDEPGFVSPDYRVFRSDPATVDLSFLEQWFRGSEARTAFANEARGTNVRRNRIGRGDFLRIELVKPPLPEQKKIAAILSSVDDAIRATQAVIDQTRRVKEGLLQELLTRGIGPDGKPHTRFKQTEIGEVPEGWEVAKLDDVAERGSGHTPSKRHQTYWDGGIPWVSLADSHRLDRVYVNETDKEISDEGIANSSAVLHPAGTVFVSRDASVGRSAIAAMPLAVSQHFIAWRCGPALSNQFLYYWLQSQKPVFESIATGSTIKTIGLPFFRSLRIPLPPRPEQEEIAARLLALDEVLWALGRAVEQHQTTKSGLLSDLLTGRVRVTP